LVISSATTVAEARWLAEPGVDAIIAVTVQSLRAKAEAQGSGDFSPLWSGQAAALGSELGAAELTHKFAAEALDRLRSLAG
jgi:nitronate monooxygenase